MRAKKFMPTALILGILVLAISNSFIQDDAFISYRYAKNLVTTGQLTWNPGEQPKIEGYTNFLWTMMMVLPLALGYDPPIFAVWCGIFFFSASILLSYKIARNIFQRESSAWLALILLGSNYTFIAYATGGLETSMQTAFILAATAAYFHWKKNKTPAFLPLFSFIATSAMLTRPDSALPVMVLLFLFVKELFAGHRLSGPVIKPLALLVLPMGVIMTAWLLWKYSYYGLLLPNTYYAKADSFSFSTVLNGLKYILAFIDEYYLIPFIIAGIYYWKKILAASPFQIFFVILSLWMLYIMKVGGDFMEFRFFVPVFPFAVFIAVCIIDQMPHRIMKVGFIVLWIAGSLIHYSTYTGVNEIESIHALQSHLENDGERWIEIGRKLHQLFPAADSSVRIAVMPAGAIPYYSELPTLDMLGINDRAVARNGILEGNRPGHQRIASTEYLDKTGVNLVVGYPRIISLKTSRKNEYSYSALRYFGLMDASDATVPSASEVLDLPFDSLSVLRVVYLHHHPVVDSLIATDNLRAHPIIRSE